MTSATFLNVIVIEKYRSSLSKYVDIVVSTSLRVTTSREDCDVLVEVILKTDGTVFTLGFPRRPGKFSKFR